MMCQIWKFALFQKNSSSAEEWSPTRKLTIAIDSGPNVDHGAGLASVGRDDVPMGYLGTGPGGLSPSSQLSEYWHNSTTTNTGGRRTGSEHFLPLPHSQLPPTREKNYHKWLEHIEVALTDPPNPSIFL
jgi:hypothetical protein